MKTRRNRHFPVRSPFAPAACFVAAFVIAIAAVFGSAQVQVTGSPDAEILEIDDAPEMQVISFGKTVIVKQRAKAVLSFGGDVVVQGNIAEDVGVFGGNVKQEAGSYIGGDVIVFGGTYLPDITGSGRVDGKKTIVYGVLEKELRDIGRDPTQLFAPAWTPMFLAQRLLSMIFWFTVSMLLITIAPGAFSRASSRLRLKPSTIAIFGLAGIFAAFLAVALSELLLPAYLAAFGQLMSFALLLLAYLYGRVTLQATIGRLFQKHFLPRFGQNETLAMFIGVFIWTVLLSIPYFWPVAVLALFVTGVGLSLTARNSVTVHPS